MSINRRDFLKTTAGTAAVASSLSLFPEEVEAKIGELKYEGEAGKWVSSSCQGCTSWCSIQGLVVDGKVIKVRGNPNSASGGRICPRPHLALQQVYDPDRVKTPLKRTNPKKGRGIDPKFVPISWDEAINTIADKIMELINAGETHKFLLTRGRYTFMNEIMYGTFPKLIGSPNNISHSALCADAEEFGREQAEGYPKYADFDLDNTRYILGWSSDMVASNRQTPWFIKQIGDVKERAKITTIDPRLSATAAKSDRWLPIVPGTDGALAVAIAHVILSEGTWCKEFVGDFADKVNYFIPGKEVPAEIEIDGKVVSVVFNEIHTNGVVAWWNLELKDRTPEWAEKITGISAKEIREVAHEFADAGRRAISWCSPGAAMQIRGGISSFACHALNGLVGSVDHVGGILQASSVPAAKTPDVKPYIDPRFADSLKKPKIDQRGTKGFPAIEHMKSGGFVVTSRVAQAMLDKDPYDIKVCIGYWNNWVFSSMGTKQWEEAMSKLPFFAHITTNIAEMSMFADIVLPAKMHMLERYGYLINKQNLQSYMSIHQPLVKPYGEAKTDETEVPFLLAQALAKKGFDLPLKYYQENFKDPETGKMPQTPEEFDLYAVKFYTKPIWDGSSNAKGDSINGWNDLLDKGVWKAKRYKIGEKIGHFHTATHKFEFFSETLKTGLQHHADKHKITLDEAIEAANYTVKGEAFFVPHYEPPVRYGDEKVYPFIFSEHRSRLNREGRSQNTPWYYEMKDVDPGDVAGKDVTKINPVDGQKLGLKDGDKIKITQCLEALKVKLSFGKVPDRVWLSNATVKGIGHMAVSAPRYSVQNQEAVTTMNFTAMIGSV